MGYHIDEHIPGDLSGNVVVITGIGSIKGVMLEELTID